MKVAKIHKNWPFLRATPPACRFTATDVLREETDTQKETMIRKWIKAVWEIWEDRHQWVMAIPDELLYKNR